ncbi:MAG TPA: TRAP transporter small permease subunit [Alphaproteobacteria bacterium]|nr:TRAP transporter small permease subunit [Alphaproteobacteria bacterium]
MLEFFRSFLNFVGRILMYFWTSFFQDTGSFFKIVAEAPFSSIFELLIVLFLVGVALTILIGTVRSVAGFSVMPLIQAVENYTRFFAWIGAWGFTLLMMSMVFEVISRYFLGAPTKWAFEVAYMLMGTSFMFGIAYCMQMRRHVRVDFLYDNLGLKSRSIIDLFGFLILLPMILWLCAGLWEYFHQAYKVNELSGESAWNPIIWPFKFTFVIGFVLLLMQTIAEVMKCILVLSKPRVLEAEGEETIG